MLRVWAHVAPPAKLAVVALVASEFVLEAAAFGRPAELAVSAAHVM